MSTGTYVLGRWRLLALALGVWLAGCSAPPPPSPAPTTAAPAASAPPVAAGELPLPRPLELEEAAALSPELREYAEGFTLLTPRRDRWKKPAEVIRLIGLAEGSAVADIGCAGGYFTYRFSRAVGPSGKVYAVDIDRRALEYVEAIVRREGDPVYRNIETVLSEPDDVKLPPSSLDVAFVCDVHYLNYVSMHGRPEERAEGMADPVRFLSARTAAFLGGIRTALRQDGRLVVIEMRRGAPSSESDLEDEGMVAVVEANGFGLEASHDILGHDLFQVFRKAP